jgi:outer membrane protein assembly factor BamB
MTGAAAQQLDGGDARAWLNAAGNAGGASFCAARLKLPLAAKPDWVSTYSLGELSSYPVSELVHYDGRICVAARSPMVLLLDTATGRKLDYTYVYEGPASQGLNEEVQAIFYSSGGALFARDDTGMCYCLYQRSGKLATRWSYQGARGDFAATATGSEIFLAATGRLRCLSLASAKEQWSFPTLLRANDVVLARSGVAVWYSLYGKAGAVLAGNGAPLWSLAFDSLINRMVIDDARSRVYVSSNDERLECRDLQTGELRWAFSWRALIAAADRQRALAQLEAVAGPAVLSMAFIPSNVLVLPDGVCIVLASGDVLSLDAEGKLRWHTRLNTAVNAALAFENGILVQQYYDGPQGRDLTDTGFAFMLEPPAWQVYRNADAERQQRGRFVRHVVLSRTDGAALSALEQPRGVRCSPIPAYDKIVLGLEGIRDAIPASVVAYNWLEPREAP